MRKGWNGPIAALLILLAGAGPAGAQAAPPGVLEVTGRGTAAAEPDAALLTMAVETQQAQAAAAVAENGRQTDALLAVLKGRMGPGDRLGTTGYTVAPVYADPPKRLTPTGYRVTNQVLLETRLVKQVGDFIDAAAGAGAGRMGGLQFKSSREEALADEAAARAVQQARRTAAVLAEAAGVTIRRVREIRYLAPGPAPRFQAEAAMLRTATPIEPGELTIEAQVTVVFELE